jgi:hypothetical protein
MYKILIVFIAISLLNACSSDSDTDNITTDLIDNPNTAVNKEVNDDMLPYFEFEEEVKNFGQITQGEVVSTSFRFKNVGQSDLIISSAQGSCGCTVPKWPKEPIKPGEESVVDVAFDSNGKHGMQNKTITLVSNTIPNTKVIALKGEVLSPKTDK